MSEASGYPTTSWSLLEVARDDGHQGGEARRRFVDLYHGPVRAYLQACLRFSDHDAEEHSQEFFVSKIFQGNVLRHADRSQGRFRHFLKRCVKNYARDVLRQRSREVGGQEELLESFPADASWSDVDQAFHLEYVRGLLGRAISRVGQRCMANDQEVHFELFCRRYTQDPDAYPGWNQVGSGVRLQDGSTITLTGKDARHKAETVLRQLRAAIREEMIEETGSRSAADEEIATLFAMFEEDR